MAAITWNKDTLAAFTAAMEEAAAADLKLFYFNGHTFPVRYALYIVSYLNVRLSR